jgi:hypothetical protein
MLCAPVAAQDARIVEKLADGSFIVAIGAIEYRALPPAKVAELAKQKVDLEASQKVNNELNFQIKEAILQRDLAQAREDIQKQKAASFEADFNRAREDSKRNFGLFMSERELRVEAQQFIPHGKTKGFMGKVLTFLDSPYSQAFWKLAVPTYQMIRCQ